MAEPQFGDHDDLPRTLRRERDAREAARQAQQHAAAGSAFGDPGPDAPEFIGPADHAASYGLVLPGTVTRLEVPFGHLVWFFLKAVLAAIPALILLTLLLFAGGKVLQAFFPALRHFEIVIKTPDAPGMTAANKPGEAAKGTSPASAAAKR